ncbi:hypothetical protein B566_EDAN004470 [Ephemera danica]|nr:hypothetical protein B566_EDAN004470 [Ephemera danica]
MLISTLEHGMDKIVMNCAYTPVFSSLKITSETSNTLMGSGMLRLAAIVFRSPGSKVCFGNIVVSKCNANVFINVTGMDDVVSSGRNFHLDFGPFNLGLQAHSGQQLCNTLWRLAAIQNKRNKVISIDDGRHGEHHSSTVSDERIHCTLTDNRKVVFQLGMGSVAGGWLLEAGVAAAKFYVFSQFLAVSGGELRKLAIFNMADR